MLKTYCLFDCLAGSYDSASPTFAAMPHPLIRSLQARGEEFVALRWDMHRHPGLGLHELRTSQRIADCLARWGYEAHRGLVTTGVAGILRRSAGPRLGLRADMNALPLQEATGRPWSSVQAGVRDLLEQRIRALVQGQAESFGVRAHVDYRRDHPVLVNAAEATRFARDFAIELVGAEQVVPQCPPFTGSEDFAVMLQPGPGSHRLIGNGDGPGGCMVHNPGHDFNDDNVALGAAYWALRAERFLSDSPQPLKDTRDEQALPA